MAEKIRFSLQVFFLGFSVVMIVLFVLYGLTALFNRLSAPRVKKDNQERVPEEAAAEIAPQLAAAIAAALNFHMTAGSGPAATSRPMFDLRDIQGSHWAAAGREALMDNSLQLDLARRGRA